jgi:hypothetical protein
MSAFARPPFERTVVRLRVTFAVAALGGIQDYGRAFTSCLAPRRNPRTLATGGAGGGPSALAGEQEKAQPILDLLRECAVMHIYKCFLW